MCVGMKEKRRKMYKQDTKVSSPIRRGKMNDDKTWNTKMRRKKHYATCVGAFCAWMAFKIICWWSDTRENEIKRKLKKNVNIWWIRIIKKMRSAHKKVNKLQTLGSKMFIGIENSWYEITLLIWKTSGITKNKKLYIKTIRKKDWISKKYFLLKAFENYVHLTFLPELWTVICINKKRTLINSY